MWPWVRFCESGSRDGCKGKYTFSKFKIRFHDFSILQRPLIRFGVGNFIVYSHVHAGLCHKVVPADVLIIAQATDDPSSSEFSPGRCRKLRKNAIEEGLSGVDWFDCVVGHDWFTPHERKSETGGTHFVSNAWTMCVHRHSDACSKISNRTLPTQMTNGFMHLSNQHMWRDA